MDPSSTPESTPSLVRDSTQANSPKTEIVSDIPVRDPFSTGDQVQPQPAAKVFRPSNTSTVDSKDKPPDQVFSDINNSVNQAKHPKKARLNQLNGPDKIHSSSPPIVATIIACLVALTLTAAAFYIYRKGY